MTPNSNKSVWIHKTGFFLYELFTWNLEEVWLKVVIIVPVDILVVVLLLPLGQQFLGDIHMKAVCEQDYYRLLHGEFFRKIFDTFSIIPVTSR